MPVFQYSALDTQGVEIKDEVEALSQKEAISKETVSEIIKVIVPYLIHRLK